MRFFFGFFVLGFLALFAFAGLEAGRRPGVAARPRPRRSATVASAAGRRRAGEKSHTPVGERLAQLVPLGVGEGGREVELRLRGVNSHLMTSVGAAARRRRPAASRRSGSISGQQPETRDLDADAGRAAVVDVARTVLDGSCARRGTVPRGRRPRRSASGPSQRSPPARKSDVPDDRDRALPR